MSAAKLIESTTRNKHRETKCTKVATMSTLTPHDVIDVGLLHDSGHEVGPRALGVYSHICTSHPSNRMTNVYATWRGQVRGGADTYLLLARCSSSEARVRVRNTKFL